MDYFLKFTYYSLFITSLFFLTLLSANSIAQFESSIPFDFYLQPSNSTQIVDYEQDGFDEIVILNKGKIKNVDLKLQYINFDLSGNSTLYNGKFLASGKVILTNL